MQHLLEFAKEKEVKQLCFCIPAAVVYGYQ
jgi:hypothetical protein